MVPDILPIVTTKVDWTNFLLGCEKALGRNVAASLDAKNMPASGAAAFSCGVKEFKQQNSDAVKAFREYSNNQHTYVGFLIVCDKQVLHEIPTKSIDYTYTEGLDCVVLITTGSLYQWYFFILGLLVDHQSVNTRFLGMKLLLWFERNDFGEVWANFRKESLLDKTYILVPK